MQEVYKRDKITIDLDSLDLLNRLFGKVNTTDQLIQELTNIYDKLRVIINDPNANERIKVTSSVMITKVQNIRECLGIKMAENQAQPNN
jgi:predicted nucleic acid-binding protein